MDRILFENNRIVEALCQFTFKSVQDNTIFGQYWEHLQRAKIYTVKEDIKAVSFTLVGNDGVTPTVANGMKFTSAVQDKIIQLHPNIISIHQVKKYQKWELFKNDIDAAFANFNEIANDTIIERIDLRAINVYDFPTLNFKLSDYFTVYSNQPKNIANTSTNITIEFPLKRKDCFIVLRINTSIQESKTNIVLDLSFVNIQANLNSSDNKGIDDILQFGHLELYNLFSSVTTDKTKVLIK